jgi:hypothetical protein
MQQVVDFVLELDKSKVSYERYVRWDWTATKLR